MSGSLRVGVPGELLDLPPAGGHGKVWQRVLAELSKHTKLKRLTTGSRARLRRLDVVLASGHDDLPSTGAPLVVQVHEAGWFDERSRATIDPAFLDHIVPRTERAVRAAAHVLVPSEAARRDLVSFYSLEASAVHAVHHGVDPVFRPDASATTGIVARARGEGGAPYVLFAAALHPRKNLPVVREAVALLARQGFPHRLAIAGHGAPDRPDSTELQQAAAAELPGAPGRVAFLGQPTDSELAALMAGADAFCLPSLYEGFGLTVLEAMACGTPVVVSDRGALPEVVADAGFAVEPRVEPVAAALRRVLGDNAMAARMAQAGLERAGGFSWQRAAEGWLKVLEQAAERPTLARR